MAQLDIEELQKAVRDGIYVTVGLGVLAFQRAQVQRNELRKQLESGSADAQKAVSESLKTVEERLGAVEERIDAALDDVEERLPDPARAALAQARTAARDARSQLRKLVVPA